MSNSRLEVDLSAMEDNLRIVRSVVSPPGEARPCRLCAVLKQNAYGAGAPRVAKRLVAAGLDMIAVYSMDEARELIEAAIGAPILVLMPVRELRRVDPLYRHAALGRLHLTLHDREQTRAVAELADHLGTSLLVHLCLDTGMSRGGATAHEATAMLGMIAEHPRLALAGIMTHFAASGSDQAFTAEQADRLDAWLADAPTGVIGTDTLVHAADTGAVFSDARHHRSMVRIGLGLHGYALDGTTPGAERIDAMPFADAARSLRPASRWTSRIVHLMDIDAGWPVGYGSTWRAERPSRVALVPIGYADGYPRTLGSRGRVLLTGRSWGDIATGPDAPVPTEPMAAPVVGRVSMDQIVIDVTGLPQAGARVGAEVELFGTGAGAGWTAADLAAAAGTVTHDVLCSVRTHVERVYRFRCEPGTDRTTTATRPGGAAVPRRGRY